MGKILITGGSGLIGSRLTEMLVAKGHHVAHLSRKKTGHVETYQWDIDSRYIEPGAFDETEVIIHLAGAGVADRPWTKKRKLEILESRTHSSRLLYDYLRSNKNIVGSFVSASAIGYYGFDEGEKVFKENDGPGVGFLADVVRKWEDEVDQITQLGIRLVKIRVGIVLSEKSGALPELAKPVRYYVGAPLGTGEQRMSWIHIEDLCRIFVKAVEDPSMQGTYNAVAPYSVTNTEFTHTVSNVLGKPLILPKIPSFALKLLLGEMASMAIQGINVSNQKLASTGFQYEFDTLEKALRDLLGKK